MRVSNSLKLYPALTDRFIRESGRVRTPKSIDTYRQHLRSLQQMFPNLGVSQFTTKHLTEWCLAGGSAPATIATKRSAVTTFFGWAKFHELVKTDPSPDLKWTVKPGKFSVRENTWLSVNQIKALLNALPETDLRERRDRVLLYVGLFTGLRLEGLVGLRWSSFSDDMTTLRLKTKGQKMVEKSVPPRVQAVLKDWRRELLPHQHGVGPLFFSFRFGPDDTLVPYWDVPLQDAGARTAVAKAGKLIGVTLRPHDMRRSYTNILEHMGYDVQTISNLLNHENIATTSHYLDKNPAKRAEQERAVDLDL